MTTENQETNKPEEAKQYAWDPESLIEITGLEYSILQKTINFPHELAALFSPASATTQTIFTRMVEKGIAKETTKEATSELEAPVTVPIVD